jgi:N-acyl-D-aspartate/D-glutamate deacylase
MPKIEIQNVLQPGKTYRVDADKVAAMKDAALKALPSGALGLTVAEWRAALDPHLSQDHFPGGERAGWWLKSVQLDQEAKGVVARADTKPLRFYRT